MRIGVEVAVLDDLLDVVLPEMAAEHVDIVAVRAQLVEVIDADAIDELHDEQVLRRELPVDLRAADVIDIAVQVLELFDVVGLHEEVHLLLGDRPHLVEDHAEVEDVLRVADDL